MANHRSDLAAVAAVASALSDESRLRALLMLEPGELCVCQIVATLGLAPSTVSRHMTLLHNAGLVDRRKEGKWHYYRLARRDADPVARAALRWVLGSVERGESAVGAACCEPVPERDDAAACYRR